MWRALKIGAILIVIGGLAVLGLVQWREERSEAELRAGSQRQIAELARRDRERAQTCIDEIARLDPAADAANDIARGDPTPIALGFTPHEGNPATYYPGVDACRYARARERDSEKRMRHTVFAFSHWQAPNQHRCEQAAIGYATAYNAEMLRRAPRAVAAFCRTHTDPDDEPVRFRP